MPYFAMAAEALLNRQGEFAAERIFAHEGGMRRVNLNDTKLTIRVSTAAKRKAAEIAKRRGLSISQLVDELISQAEETKLDEETLRAIVSEELEKWGGSAKEAKLKKRPAR
jgi:hypothetical protein